MSSALLLLLTLLSGCGLFGDGATDYVVVKGDTLFVIARDHGVTVDQLRGWNDLQGDLIEIDQVLKIYASPPEPDDANPSTVPGPRKRLAAATVRVENTPKEAPVLVMPDPKPCLGGPELDDLTAEEQMIGNSGLSTDQVREAMNRFVDNTLGCITGDDTFPGESLMMEITVACDGTVSRVVVTEAGDWSGQMSDCVTDVLRYAPFPAHDLPSGEVFQYPLRFTPG